MSTANDPLIRLEGIKKVFYTDEVETHALADVHLSIGIDSLTEIGHKGEMIKHFQY